MTDYIKFYVSTDLDTPLLSHDVCSNEIKFYEVGDDPRLEGVDPYSIPGQMKLAELHTCPEKGNKLLGWPDWFTGERK